MFSFLLAGFMCHSPIYLANAPLFVRQSFVKLHSFAHIIFKKMLTLHVPAHPFHCRT